MTPKILKAMKIHSIKVLPLYGIAEMFETLAQATSFIKKQPETGMRAKKPFVRMEVTIRFTSGSVLEGGFPNKAEALNFMKFTGAWISSNGGLESSHLLKDKKNAVL